MLLPHILKILLKNLQPLANTQANSVLQKQEDSQESSLSKEEASQSKNVSNPFKTSEAASSEAPSLTQASQPHFLIQFLGSLQKNSQPLLKKVGILNYSALKIKQKDQQDVNKGVIIDKEVD